MESSAVLSIARQYAAAVSAVDFGAVTRMCTDDIVWHHRAGTSSPAVTAVRPRSARCSAA